MKLTFAIDRGNGSEVVTVGPAAIVAWELENRTKVSQLASTGIGVADMTELVWRQLKLGGETQTLDAFRGSLLDIDPELPADPS